MRPPNSFNPTSFNSLGKSPGNPNAGLEKSLDGTPEKAKAMRDVIQAEFEKIAVEVLGEKGRALVQKMADENGGKR